MSETDYVSFVTMLIKVVAVTLLAGALVIAATRLSWNTRGGWGACGAILLIIAIGNSVLLSMGTSFLGPDGHAPLRVTLQSISLAGLVVFGSMGSRFVAEWLTAKVSK